MTSNCSRKVFNVHRSLLVKNAPKLKIEADYDGTLHANINAEQEDYLTDFLYWLYTGELDAETVWSNDGEELTGRLATHGLARKVGCIEYMDEVFDHIINLVSMSEDRFGVDEVVNAITCHFEPGSGGWRFGIDYAVYNRYPGRKQDNLYDEMSDIKDNVVLKEIVTKLCQAADWSQPTTFDPEFCIVLISGSCEARCSYGDFEALQPPWELSKCWYHRHTELGLPCYPASDS